MNSIQGKNTRIILNSCIKHYTISIGIQNPEVILLTPCIYQLDNRILSELKKTVRANNQYKSSTLTTLLFVNKRLVHCKCQSFLSPNLDI